MKKIDLDNTLTIFNDNEIVAIYEVKKTKTDIAKALVDSGCFDDVDEDEWDIGVGDNNECYSLEDVAEKIVEDKEFFVDDYAFKLGMNFNTL